MDLRHPRRMRRAALQIAGAVTVLAGATVVVAPAASAASSGYAVSELPIASSTGGIVADPVTNTIYAGDSDPEGSIGVAVIDGATNTLAAQVSLRLPPAAVAVDTSSNSVYAISVDAPATAYVINGASNAVTTTFSLPAIEALAATVNSMTHMIYVTDSAGTVVVINGTTDKVATQIKLSEPVLDPTPAPDGIGVDSATNTVYVADSGQVDVIDGATNVVTGRIALPAGSAAAGLVVDSTAGRVYVADQGTGAISVITTATDAVSTLTQGLSGPAGLALDSGTGTLYATTPGTGSSTDLGTTYVIDTASGSIADQIPRGGTSVAVTPASDGSAFVNGSAALQMQGDVTVMTPSTANTMSPIMVPWPCCNMTFTVGRPGQVQLMASATPAATFSSTDLPGWLSLSPSGLLSGTPPAGSEGLYSPVVTVANGVAPPFSTGASFDVADFAILSADQAAFAVGAAGSFIVTAGFLAPTFSEAGALPAGVTFSAAGVLSGTPAPGSAGTYPITITASSSAGTATQAFTLFVDVPGAALPTGGVLGDVTGDGLADILAIDPAGNLWLYPNTGSGDANMFADARSQVGSGWTGYTLAAVASLHGSEAPGILAIDQAGRLWYYPNTGGAGFHTFGARSQVGTGWNAYTVVGLTDLYGTGQPGIVAIDTAGNLWYYPGTGGTGTSTFGARSLVGIGWTGYTADVGNLVGNLRPDLLAVDSSGNLWYYPNTDGGTGTNTFSMPTQLNTGWSGYRAVDIGALTSGGSGANILGVDPGGNLFYYPNTGGSPIQDLYGTPIQVGSGWTGYRIN